MTNQRMTNQQTSQPTNQPTAQPTTPEQSLRLLSPTSALPMPMNPTSSMQSK
jgi:hypothetical protein